MLLILQDICAVCAADFIKIYTMCAKNMQPYLIEILDSNWLLLCKFDYNYSNGGRITYLSV